MSGQGDISPDFLKWRDALCFVPPTNAHGIHWMIVTIFVKFSQLILMKIIKIVATRCQILRLKCTKFNFGWGAYSAPEDLLAGFKGSYF